MAVAMHTATILRDYFVSEYLANDVGEREAGALRREVAALIHSSVLVLQSSFRDIHVELHPFPQFVPVPPGLSSVRVVLRDVAQQVVFSCADERLLTSVAEAMQAQISSQILALNFVAKARQAKREWETAADLLNDEIYLFDAAWRVHRLNRKAAARLGGEPKSFPGSCFPAELVGGEQVLSAALPTDTADARHFIVGEGAQFFTVRIFQLDWAPGRTGYILMRTECTADVQGQRAQLRSARLVGLGQVSMGLAHEINNPLGVILTAAGSLQRRFANQPQVMELAGIITDEVERCRRITHALLEFGRHPERAAEPIAVDRVLAALPARIHAIYPECRFRVDAPCNAYLTANEDDLIRLLTNLVSNAYEASPESEIVVRARLDHRAGRIEVEDQGDPIPPEVATKMFNPFFTTKLRGTGLGLSFAQKIVESLGGRLAYERREGNVFVAELPLQVLR